MIVGATAVGLRVWDQAGVPYAPIRPIWLPQTKIIWNGTDITRTLDRSLDIKGTGIYQLDSFLLSDGSELMRPQDGFAVARFDGSKGYEVIEQPIEGMVGDQMGLLWILYSVPKIFGYNGKRVKSVSFHGLEDGELIGLAPDGLLLQFQKTGRRILYYTITDSRGVQSESGLIFQIEDP